MTPRQSSEVSAEEKRESPILHGDRKEEPREADEAQRRGSVAGGSSRDLHGWKWAVAYTSMLSTTFLFSLDNTIVADIQPSIILAFDEVELLPWIGSAFALGTMAILPWGKAYGVCDIKWLYLFNIFLFEVGSALCGAANNMRALIIGRVIAGVGGSGMYSGTLTYVSVLTSMTERPVYLSGSTVVWGVGSVLGPVVGGGFAISSATWRWAFYINLVIGAVFAPAYILLLPRVDPRPGSTLKEKCRMIDWLGTTIFLGGSVCLVMAISFGGSVFAWGSESMITLWVMTGVLLAAMVLSSTFHPGIKKENRLYPAHFFCKPVILNLQVQVFLSSGIVLAMTYFLPLFFQFVRGDGPLDAGVRLLPLVASMVVFAMLNGLLMPRISDLAVWYVFGSAFTLIGCALMYTVDINTPNANIYGYTVLVGIGTGSYIVAGFAAVQSLVPPADIANAVGAMAISQDLGMVLFIAISGSMFTNIALSQVGSVLPGTSRNAVANLIIGTSSEAFKNLSQQERDAVIPEIVDSLSNVWLLFLVGAALSFVLALPLVKTRLTIAAHAVGGGG